MSKTFTHLDEDGNINMVDVSSKTPTKRIAVAKSSVIFPAHVFAILKESGFITKKGNLIQTAVIAGIGAIKRTADLIPLCHNILIEKSSIDIDPIPNGMEISCTVRTTGKTGVEMEALTGVSVAALCIYDMCKALSHEIVIGNTYLESKSGGKNEFTRT